jgi:hypothetical protein
VSAPGEAIAEQRRRLHVIAVEEADQDDHTDDQGDGDDG